MQNIQIYIKKSASHALDSFHFTKHEGNKKKERKLKSPFLSVLLCYCLESMRLQIM